MAARKPTESWGNSSGKKPTQRCSGEVNPSPPGWLPPASRHLDTDARAPTELGEILCSRVSGREALTVEGRALGDEGMGQL